MNLKIYLREVIYGFVQAILILYFSFITLNRNSSNTKGFFGSLVDAGDFVFLCAVFVANVKILVASFQIGFGIILTILVSIIGYVVCEAIVSETSMFIETEFYLNMHKLATFPAVYFALFLFVFAFAIIDRALELLRHGLKMRNIKRIDRREDLNKMEALNKSGLVKEK